MTFDCKANTCLCDGSCCISLFIQQCVSTVMFSSHIRRRWPFCCSYILLKLVSPCALYLVPGIDIIIIFILMITRVRKYTNLKESAASIVNNSYYAVGQANAVYSHNYIICIIICM